MKPNLGQRARNIYQQLKEKSMINKYTSPIFLLIISILHSEAFAKGEFKKAKTLMESVRSGLIGLSTVTVILAIAWCGYKILFGGSTLREMAPILIGAVVLGGATEIGTLLTAGNK